MRRSTCAATAAIKGTIKASIKGDLDPKETSEPVSTIELPETFQYEKRGRIAVMTINRPDAMNAFTAEMLRAMDACFEDFQNDPELWVAIFTANGDKAFCTGMDLKEAIPMLQSGDQMGY